MFRGNFAIISILPTALDQPYCMVKNAVSRMKYRWAWGYDVASVAMVRVSAEITAELPDTASVFLFAALWLMLMEKAAEHIGWGTRYINDMVDGWFGLSEAAVDAMEEAKQRMAKARRRKECEEGTDRHQQRARQREQARHAKKTRGRGAGWR